MSELKLARESTAVGTTTVAGVDVKSMSVTSVLSTATEDRDYDIIEPAGIELGEHRRNPVVFFNHFRPKSDPSLFTLPIGKAEDDRGNYTVKLLREPDRLIATTYFSQKTPVAQAIFSLYEEGILRAWSIGVKVLDAKPRPAVDRPWPGPMPMHVMRSELQEYSAVGVGSNRDALTVKLQKGFGLNGPGSAPIELMLKAALEPYTIPPTAWAFGWTPLEKAMPEPVDTVATEPLENADQVPEKMDKAADVPVVTKSDDAPAVPDVAKSAGSDMMDMPAGASYLGAMIDHINEAMSKVENPDVVATYKKCGKLVNKCWSKCYSGYGEKACKGCGDDDDMQKQLDDALTKLGIVQQENAELKTKSASDAEAFRQLSAATGNLRETIYRLTGRAG